MNIKQGNIIKPLLQAPVIRDQNNIGNPQTHTAVIFATV